MTDPRPMSPRWTLAWRLLSAATFAIVAFAGLSGEPIPGRFWLYYVLLLAWYVSVTWIGRARFVSHEPWSFFYFGIGVVLWALMLGLHPVAYAFATIMFPTCYSHLSIKYSIPTGLAVTAVMPLAGNHWRIHPSWGDALAALLVAASSVMLSLFIHSIIRQSIERKRLIDELESTRASLAESERSAGMLAERQRLAQQIHDTVAQGYVGIVTHLEAAEAELRDREPGARSHMAEAKASARASLAEARRLVWDLRPDLRDGAPLPEVLDRLLREWADKSGVTARQVVTGTLRSLDTNRETAMLQAVREALNNVRTHARAKSVTVTLSYMDDEVAVDVQDDGAGVSAAAPSPGGGFGLKALEERVRGLGGTLALESTPGRGTTLSVSLPSEPGG